MSPVMESTNSAEREFVPGTVHLVDLEGTMHAKHASGGEHDIVLVPAPSSDPDDPLNWSPRRKLISTSCMCMYTLMVGIASAAIYSVLEPISEDTGLTLGDLNAGKLVFLMIDHDELTLCRYWLYVFILWYDEDITIDLSLANAQQDGAV